MDKVKSGLFLLFCLVTVSWQLGTTSRAPLLAQSAETEWKAPVNLSHSGTAAGPQLLVDNNGRFHALWRDSFSGLIYTRRENETWTTPLVVTDLPFGHTMPHLLAVGGRVHAFWLDDGDTTLFHSSAPAGAVSNAALWSEPLPLANGVLAVAATVDGRGVLHLAMLRAAIDEAGLFYQQSTDEGATWSAPNLLYDSSYYRLLSQVDAHLSLTTRGAALLLAWDDRPFDRLLLRRSVDFGGSWTEPMEIGSDVTGVHSGVQTLILAENGQMHLVWRSGQSGTNCTLYHQWSPDGGVTWSPSQPLLRVGCPDLVQFLQAGAAIYLLAGSNLLVWQETTWSAPQPQPPLSGFTPTDGGRRVSYTCGIAAAVQAGQLLVAACGESVGQDVWFTSRSLLALRQQVIAPPPWREPSLLVTAAAPAHQPAFDNLQLLADANGRFHAFWSQIGSSDVHYARYDANSGWSRIVALSSPNGSVDTAPRATLSASGLLLLVWSENEIGDLYFSRANVAQSLNPNDWSAPQRLPLPHRAASVPDILVDAAGILHVAYAVPLNEQRGIYVIRSRDNGDSWEAPETVFDAAAAGWEMVDQPRLSYTAYDTLHILWLRRPLPGNRVPATLHYTNNGDGDWSSPQTISTGQTTAVETVTWANLVGVGLQGMHLVWRTAANTTAPEGVLWQQYSKDNGRTWSRPARVSGLEANTSAAVLLADTATQMHLLSLSQANNQWQVHAFMWQEERWQAGEALLLPASQRLPYPLSLAAAVAPDGQLALLYPGQTAPADDPTTLLHAIFWSGRTFLLPDTLPTPLPTLTPTATPLPQPTATPGPQPTATLVFPTGQSEGLRLNVLPDQRINQVLAPALLALGAAIPLIIIALLLTKKKQKQTNTR